MPEHEPTDGARWANAMVTWGAHKTVENRGAMFPHRCRGLAHP